MKIRLIAIVLLVCLVGISVAGCSFVNPPSTAAPAANPQTTLNTQFQTFMTNQATQNTKDQAELDRQKALVDQMQKDIADLKSKVGTGSGGGYTTQQIDAKFQQFISGLSQADIDVLKGKLGVTSSSSSSTSAYTTPTGQVSYTIGNPQTYYQFGTGSSYPLQIKVFNNKSDARYVRLTLTATTFNNMTAGAFGSPAIAIATNSNSVGQTPALYTVNAVGNTVLLIATSGGVNGTGEYLLSSGQEMSLYITLTINSANAVLWTLTVSGSDRPIS